LARIFMIAEKSPHRKRGDRTRRTRPTDPAEGSIERVA